MQKTVFVSNVSFEDAARQAQQAGYIPIGQAMNRRGQYVIFARSDAQNKRDIITDRVQQTAGVSQGNNLASKIW